MIPRLATISSTQLFASTVPVDFRAPTVDVSTLFVLLPMDSSVPLIVLGSVDSKWLSVVISFVILIVLESVDSKWLSVVISSLKVVFAPNILGHAPSPDTPEYL